MDARNEESANGHLPLTSDKMLEICCFRPDAVRTAFEAGANRVELCSHEEAGGLTPRLSTYRELSKVKSDYPIARIYVMIRPRPGNFLYDLQEMEMMRKAIRYFRGQGAHGFVFGCLDKDNLVDREQCGELIEHTSGAPCTFHRAFDQIPLEHQKEQLEVLIALGFKSVLTSGASPTALEGVNVLESLVKQAAGRIDIMAGGGVRSTNIEELVQKTRATWFHSSAILSRDEKDTEIMDNEEDNGMIKVDPENQNHPEPICDLLEVLQTVQKLRAL